MLSLEVHSELIQGAIAFAPVLWRALVQRHPKPAVDVLKLLPDDRPGKVG